MQPERIKLDGVEIYAPRKLVVDALRYVSGGSALDLGCGFGRHSLFLAHKGFSVTSVDSDPQRLESLREKAEQLGVSIRREQDDIERFDARGEKYDLVLSTMVLHFLPDEESVKRAVYYMQAATARGGANVVCAYTDKSQPDLRPHLIAAAGLKRLYERWDMPRFKEYRGTDARIDGPDKGKEIRRMEMIALKSSVEN